MLCILELSTNKLKEHQPLESLSSPEITAYATP